jgi:hypothetical protein
MVVAGDCVMVTHQAQLSFLKDLVLQSNPEESRRLLRRIHQAERQERVSRRWTIVLASGIASWWTAVALVTQGWSWVWQHSEHPVAVMLWWMGGIAGFGLLLVGGCWFWHRTALRRVIDETHRFLAGWLVSRAQPGPSAELDRAARNRRPRLTRCPARRPSRLHSCKARLLPPSRWRG